MQWPRARGKYLYVFTGGKLLKVDTGLLLCDEASIKRHTRHSIHVHDAEHHLYTACAVFAPKEAF